MRLSIAIPALVLALVPSGAAGAEPAGIECVIHEWAVSPGIWTGSGDTDPTPLLMTESTRWEFELTGCSLASGTCDVFGSGSRSYQNGSERTEWYPTATQPTITNPVGNTVVYDFSMRDAFVPIQGQPRFEDMDWTLTATLPSPPSDSPSAAELATATSLGVAITHWVDNTIFVISWSGTSTETVFTSCTPVVAELTIDDVVQSEGSSGSGPFTFTVTRNHNDDAVTVLAETADGTAVAGSDFTGFGPTPVDFAAGGSLTQSIVVTVDGDSTVELDESFSVVLSSPSNATIVDGVGDATVLNDDSATLSISSTTLPEGSGGGTTPFAFTVTLNGTVDTTVSVDFDTIDKTAEDESGDGDYNSTQGTLDFPSGSGQPEAVVVDVVADDRPEQDEAFLVDLSNVVAGGRDVTLDGSQGTATVLNDEIACPSLVIYQQPFDSPAERSGHAATAGAGATYENVVDGSGSLTTLPPGPVTALRLWGFGETATKDCLLDPVVPFDVVFAADGAGVPGTILAERIGLLARLSDAGSGVARIDLDFTAVEGSGISWISVQREEVDGCAFRWLAEDVRGSYDDLVFTDPSIAPDDAYFCVGDISIFADGFESGDSSAWDTTVP